MPNVEELLNFTPEELKELAAIMLLACYFAIFGEIIFAAVQYAIRAFALTAIARKLHIDNPSAAWIPFGHAYIEGKICDHMLSPDLDRSRTRIHYLMLNLLYSIINIFTIGINFNEILRFCQKMFFEGVVPLSSLSEQGNTMTIISGLSTLLLLTVAFFRIKTVLSLYYCFDKKNGRIWVMLSAIFPIVSAFVYLSFIKKQVVHDRIEIKKIPPTE